MHDTLRLVSSDDVGRDEASVQSLLKKHKDVTDELKNYQSVIEALHEQAANLGEQVRFLFFIDNNLLKNRFFSTNTDKN
jgi:spectrin beta